MGLPARCETGPELERCARGITILVSRAVSPESSDRHNPLSKIILSLQQP